MRIEYEKDLNLIPFGDITCGDMFKYDRQYFIKL